MSRRIEDEIQNTQPLASDEVALALAVQRTGDFLFHWLNELLGPYGLRADEYNVLRILRGAGTEGHPSREVQKRMIEEPKQFPALIHGLRTRGLVGGTIQLTITDEGMSQLEELDGVVEEAIRRRLQGIGRDRIRTAIEVMDEIRTGG